MKIELWEIYSWIFDCLPHDLLIVKLEAYGLGRSSLLLLLSYLKDCKQLVKIKGIQIISADKIKSPTRINP